MQNVLAKGRLLDDQGKLLQAGYSTAYARTYRRDDIKASKWRIKEWDYYLVSDGERALAFTLSDIGYLALASISLVDLKEKNFVTKTGISPFPFGKHNFPSDFNKGDVGFECGNIAISMRNDGKARRIKAECKNFKDGKNFFAEITLSQPPRDAMVIATPFPGNDFAFYYNAKVNCMAASGYYEIGDEMTVLDATKSLGTLDWGRGVWPYSNTWYWSSMQHRTENGGTIGFNLGYGFGDTSQATENMFFVNGRAHKLNNVDFGIPGKGRKADLMKPWHFTDDEGRLEMTFTPAVNRRDVTNVGIICTAQNQVFGHFSGHVVLDDGSKLQFENCAGFAEKVVNRW